MRTKKWIFIAVIICFISQLIYGQEKQFMYDGQMRTYIVYEPSLEPNPNGYPLVIGLHGTGASGYDFIGTASLLQINPSTMIKYQLAKSSHIVLTIYNLAGQELATLVNEFQAAGEYGITWQPKGLPSGLYFYRIQTKDPSASAGQLFSETKKLITQK